MDMVCFCEPVKKPSFYIFSVKPQNSLLTIALKRPCPIYIKTVYWMCTIQIYHVILVQFNQSKMKLTRKNLNDSYFRDSNYCQKPFELYGYHIFWIFSVLHPSWNQFGPLIVKQTQKWSNNITLWFEDVGLVKLCEISASFVYEWVVLLWSMNGM